MNDEYSRCHYGNGYTQAFKGRKMEKLQILVAAMNQRDFSLVEKMNIRTDVVIASQGDFNDIREEAYAYGRRTMICTATKGVGLNRNIALLASSGDYLLFADDDIIYRDDVSERVTAAFRENPRADVIIFSMDYTRNGEVIERRHLKDRQLHIWNAMRYGAVVMAVRREAVVKHRLSYSQLFGGGCLFGSGEDSIFLKDCFQRGLKVYSNSYVLGQCSRDSSSWFSGYNEKYFYDKGVLYRQAFSWLSYGMAVRFAWKMAKRAKLPYGKCVHWMLKGIRGGKHLLSYEEYQKQKGEGK